MPLAASIFIKISILEVHRHLLESVAVHYGQSRGLMIISMASPNPSSFSRICSTFRPIIQNSRRGLTEEQRRLRS